MSTRIELYFKSYPDLDLIEQNITDFQILNVLTQETSGVIA